MNNFTHLDTKNYTLADVTRPIVDNDTCIILNVCSMSNIERLGTGILFGDEQFIRILKQTKSNENTPIIHIISESDQAKIVRNIVDNTNTIDAVLKCLEAFGLSYCELPIV